MKDIYILSIETSCDETSIAIVKNGTDVVALTILTQMDTHAEFGGVVPEIASRMHTENITMVLEETLNKAKMKVSDVKVVGFYLQKLLSSNLDNTKDYDTARENTLKLEGYSIDNEAILSKFDTTYSDSKLIKSMKTSSNGFYTYSKVLSEEEIDKLVSDTDNLIEKTVDNILSGDFTIDPKVINGDNVSCKFCDYKDVCYKREKDLTYINKESE